MESKKITGVPDQYKGAAFETEAERFFDDQNMIAQQFAILKQRFLNINQWKDYCGKGFAEFKLFDAEAFPVSRIPIVGDFIRIDIPGPGNPKTKGYDWVQIVNIDDRSVDNELERCLMTCRPSEDPDDKNNQIAHFYTAESSSNFVISRGKDYIKVGIYGRNEVPNFSKTGWFGKIRNAIIAIGGFLKLTKFQWNGLAKGLLDF